jgi:hypothetical protein
VTIDAGDRQYRLTVTDVVPHATTRVKQANAFNDDPPPGMDYLLMRMNLDYLKGPPSKPLTTPWLGYAVLVDAQLWSAFAVPPEPKFANQDVVPGQSVEGWLPPFIVPADGIEAALLSFRLGPLDPTGGTWFSLGPASDTPAPLPRLAPSLGAIDAASARRPDAAVPLGAPALLQDAGRVIELQVTDVIRDAGRDPRTAALLKARPAPGDGYLLVKLKARYLSGPLDQPWTTPDRDYGVFAQNRVFGRAVGVATTPEPTFGSHHLLPGGEVEGWLPALELPLDAMEAPVLSYGRGRFGGGQTWFALE